MKKLNITSENLDTLVNDFKEGVPIAIPTDTNYNLLCNPQNLEAINQVFKFKKRSFDKPLSLFFYNPQDIYKYSKNYDELLLKSIVKQYLPGPLNIILTKNTNKFDLILNGSDTIAFGSIKNKNWRLVVKAINSPVALTSANISGTADNCLVDEKMLVEQMSGNLRHYVHGNNNLSSKSSTIIKIVDNKIELVREGDISFSDICSQLDEKGVSYEC